MVAALSDLPHQKEKNYEGAEGRGDTVEVLFRGFWLGTYLVYRYSMSAAGMACGKCKSRRCCYNQDCTRRRHDGSVVGTTVVLDPEPRKSRCWIRTQVELGNQVER